MNPEKHVEEVGTITGFPEVVVEAEPTTEEVVVENSSPDVCTSCEG